MADKLKEYQNKRKFQNTKEPQGKVRKSSDKNLRFVVQHHIASRDHFDFRLEWDGVLKSWAVPKGPSYNSKDKRLAVQVEDHPFDYRNFEGTIPKGQYGGGTVMIWDEGTWEPVGDANQMFQDGSLKFTLEGSRLKGKWALVRMKTSDEEQKNWLLIKEKDEYENAFDVSKFHTSATTGRTMDEITEEVSTDQPKATAAKTKKPSLDDIKLTNPDKVLYPKSGITKGDVAKYYAEIAPRMLPYIENRILSIIRCPQGIDGACFYKKHPTGEGKGISTVTVAGSEEKSDQYFYVTDVYGILHEVQMNTLEFHPWGSRVETLEKPDTMVFDLDPDEGMALEQIRQGVLDLKGILDQLSLTSYLKTSGGKGYHVVIPFQPAKDWDSFHDFAQNVAKTMESAWPDRYTSNVRKDRRKGRIFIDYIRNGRGATSVAPYSIRAREGAPVSMPIAWKELDTIGPQDISMEESIKRSKRSDPWSDFFEQAQKLK